MRGYISLKSYNKDGNLGINLKVFETIAYQTLNDIKGIKKRSQSDEKIKPSVQASIKNNKVSFKFNLLLEKDVSKEIVKDVKKMAEEAKVGVRAARRDGMEEAKAEQKEGNITEDELKQAEIEIQKITDKNIEEIDKILEAKEKEVMSV